MQLTKEKLFLIIRSDGVEDWESVSNALEDRAYLKMIGVEDFQIPVVEDARDHALQMAKAHPDHAF